MEEVVKDSQEKAPDQKSARWQRLACGVLMLAGATLGGNTAAKHLGVTEGQVGPLTVEVQHEPLAIFSDQPKLSAQLAPGFPAQVPAAHESPFLRSNARVTDVNAEKVTELRDFLDTATSDDTSALEVDLQDQLQQLADHSAKKTVVAGGFGALGGGLAAYGLFNVLKPLGLRRRQLVGMLGTSIVLSGVLPSASFALAYNTINEQAIRNPELGGYLKDVDEVAQTAELSLQAYQEKSGALTQWIEQIVSLRDELLSDQPDSQYIKLLGISDIHSRPCTYGRVQMLAEAFDVTAIFNNGDEYEWGLSLEDQLRQAETVCPQGNSPDDVSYEIIQVKGNHDSEEMMGLLDQLENVTVTDGSIYTLWYHWNGAPKRIRVLGIADKRYTADDALTGENEGAITLQLLSDEERQLIAQGDYDILMTHDPNLFQELDTAGLLPTDVSLLAAGHTHRAQVDQQSYDAPLLVTGSTGGGGLRTYQNGGQATAFSVVYLEPESLEVVRIDLISVDNDGRFSIRNVDVEATG